jgi:hypothetical protein
MKKSLQLWMVIALECIALEIGAYTSAALLYQERLKLFVLTGLLCLLAGMIGMVVTRAKTQIPATVILMLGLVTLGIGLYLRLVLHYHERAYTTLGIGILGLLGGYGGIILPRSKAVVYQGLLLFGLSGLSLGLYFLTFLGYHGRAYMVLGTGTLCLFGSLLGLFMSHHRTSIAGG